MIMDENQLRYMWKVKPSDLEGYIRCYYMVTPEGDELQLDYNFSRQMARVSIKLEAENGREYFAVIKSGTILQERDVASRRPADLTSKLRDSRGYFKYLNDDMVLKTIGGNYDLPDTSVFHHENDRPRRLEDFYGRGYPYASLKKPGFRERIRQILEKRRENEIRARTFGQKVLRRLPAETLDISLGALLIGAYLQHLLSLTELAGFMGALGIFSGAWDWVWRQRSPFLPKVLLMLATSMGAVYFQIQNRVWGIFL